MAGSIDHAVSGFLGFREKSRDTESAGMVDLWRQVRLLCLGLPNVLVTLHPWDANVDDLAEFFWRMRPRNGILVQHHLVFGYSYGGDRANKLCKALHRRGDCYVDHLFLCDAVRRWGYLPGVSAALGIGRIVVPPNVGEVCWYRQKNPRWSFQWPPFDPAGHDVVAEDPKKTKVPAAVVKPTTHRYMDNDASFHTAVLAEVERMVAGAMGELG